MPIRSLIDEVAVERDDQIVMALRQPWCMDAAEVIYKNDNVGPTYAPPRR